MNEEERLANLNAAERAMLRSFKVEDELRALVEALRKERAATNTIIDALIEQASFLVYKAQTSSGLGMGR